jgi:hypothetical protein
VRLPIYGIRAAGEQPSIIPDDALMQGMFWGGGARFELSDGATTFTRLVVRKADLERVLQELKREPLEL